MTDQHADFYRDLRKKFTDWVQTDEGKKSEWAEYLMLVPDFFYLLTKLVLDSRVPAAAKAKLAGVIVYFIMPIDIIPEALIGPLGFLDDLALTAYVLNQILKQTDRAILEEHWTGEGELLEKIREVIDKADQMIGAGLWDRVKRWANKQGTE